MTLATWPSAWTPASVRPAPCTVTGPPSNRASAASRRPCTDSPVGLPLPADEAGAIVGKGQLEGAHRWVGQSQLGS